MAGEFAGKVAVVTGAGSGIGQAGALAFAREGARVVVADVDEAAAARTVDTIKQGGGEALWVRADVSRSEDVRHLVEAAVQAYGHLDYAFNNAGISGASAPTAEYPEESWNQVIGINLTGVWLCVKYEIAQMLANGGGAIVNNASILGLVGFANAPAYVSAKHGVIGLTQTAAIEYATRGIRVNAVCPGFIETPMLERAGVSADTEAGKAIANLHAMKRMGTPEEIAAVAVWLCSGGASFITGQAIVADGGYLAQ